MCIFDIDRQLVPQLRVRHTLSFSQLFPLRLDYRRVKQVLTVYEQVVPYTQKAYLEGQVVSGSVLTFTVQLQVS